MWVNLLSAKFFLNTFINKLKIFCVNENYIIYFLFIMFFVGGMHIMCTINR